MAKIIDKQCKLVVRLDKSIPNNSKEFAKLKSVSVTKPELFKYGVMISKKPEHIDENDFEYLQSKVPGLEAFLSDFVQLHSRRIVNTSADDRMMKLASEVIEIGR